jgi:hypothetical protein
VSDTGDSVSIEELNVYISHIKFMSEVDSFQEENSYHLLKASDSASYEFFLNIPKPFNFTQISFMIGVDSIANSTGAKGGDLDLSNGMYWAWNTGYINAKLIGHSPTCKTLHQQFDFHIGGFLAPFNTSRIINLPLSDIRFSKGEPNTICIQIDVAEWLKDIHLAKENSIVIPCKEAMKMADDYMRMFHIVDPNLKSR